MAQQEGTTPDSVPLAARVDELEQQILVLKRLRELEGDSIATAAKDKATVTANGKDGFCIKSADGKYVLKLRGYAQADGRFYGGDEAKAVPNTFFLRRARPIVEATVGKYFGFRIMPDFAQGQTVLFDAYGDINLTPAFAFRLGKFKPPVGLERLQSATDIVFAERGLPTNLVPNRDIGLQLGGDVHSGCYLRGRGLQRRAGPGERRRRPERLQGPRCPHLPPARQHGSLKGLGIGIAGDHRHRAGRAERDHAELGAAVVPVARPADRLPLPGRRGGAAQLGDRQR